MPALKIDTIIQMHSDYLIEIVYRILRAGSFVINLQLSKFKDSEL
jgi:hypothetical protein